MPPISRKRRRWKIVPSKRNEEKLKQFRARHERYLAEKAAVTLSADLEETTLGAVWCAASSGWSSRKLTAGEYEKYMQTVAEKAESSLLFGGEESTAEASAAVTKAAEAKRRAEAAKQLADEAMALQHKKAMEDAASEAERKRLEEEFQRGRLKRQQEETEAAEKAEKEAAEAAAAESKLMWQRVRSNTLKPSVILDVFVFTVGVCAADIGSDMAVARAFVFREFWVFFGIAFALLIVPMCLCWFRFYVDGKAKWYEAPMYVLQVKTMQEVYNALKSEDGKKGFDLLFINVCEVCFESFPQSLLATYALLIGIVLNSGEGYFGIPAVRIFEASILISWATAARFLATMDEYRKETNSIGKIPIVLKLVRMAFRFSEVSVRVLSIAFFAAIMRPKGLGSHGNGQVAVWVLLAADFSVMFLVCRFVAGQRQHNIIYAGICVLCAPLHFITKLQKILSYYYALRIIELLCMAAIVWGTSEWIEIVPILERDQVLWIAARVCGVLFLGFLLLNSILAWILPENRLYGGDSWLIVPRYRQESSSVDRYEAKEDNITEPMTSRAGEWVDVRPGKTVLEVSFAAPASELRSHKDPLLRKANDYMPLSSNNV